MPRQRPHNPLRLERLEDRATPALFGNPWPDSGRVTLSFVPDGTDVSGVGSSLGATMGNMPAATWQGRVRPRVPDLGPVRQLERGGRPRRRRAAGRAPARPRGGQSRGDIRVSARPLSGNVLAVTNPFDLHSAWAGDIVVNSDKLFTRDAAAGRYDLFTVAAQEAGHALGLDNSPEAASVMFTTYSTPKTGLTAGDVTAIQKLYGSRDPDRFDLDKANDKADKATPISFVANSGQLAGDPTAGDTPFVAAADLSTANDKDHYAFKNPQELDLVHTVAIQTAGVSQLEAKVSLIGPDGKGAKFRTPSGELTSSADAVSVAGRAVRGHRRRGPSRTPPTKLSSSQLRRTTPRASAATGSRPARTPAEPSGFPPAPAWSTPTSAPTTAPTRRSTSATSFPRPTPAGTSSAPPVSSPPATWTTTRSAPRRTPWARP